MPCVEIPSSAHRQRMQEQLRMVGRFPVVCKTVLFWCLFMCRLLSAVAIHDGVVQVGTSKRSGASDDGKSPSLTVSDDPAGCMQLTSISSRSSLKVLRHVFFPPLSSPPRAPSTLHVCGRVSPCCPGLGQPFSFSV